MTKKAGCLVVQPPFRAILQVGERGFDVMLKPVMEGVASTGNTSVDELLRSGDLLMRNRFGYPGTVSLELGPVKKFGAPISALRDLQWALERFQVEHQLTYTMPVGMDSSRVTTAGLRRPNSRAPYSLKADAFVPAGAFCRAVRDGAEDPVDWVFNRSADRGGSKPPRIEMKTGGVALLCSEIAPVRNPPFSLDDAKKAACYGGMAPPGEQGLQKWISSLSADGLHAAVSGPVRQFRDKAQPRRRVSI